MIIPSIDIQNGKVVQLRQGSELVYTDERHPVELVRYFARFGPVAVIDLDAAMGTGSNEELIAACCAAAPCRVGGGIRSEEAVLRWIRRGAEKVIIGTAAKPELLSKFPRDWLIVALDSREGEVVVEGWKRGTGETTLDRARELAPFCSEFLFTCVEREGMLGGAAIALTLELAEAVDVPVTAAGGITTVEEISTLIQAGCRVQIGRAIYEGRIDLVDAWTRQIKFDDSGLVPIVVQDKNSDAIRMVAYGNTESMASALRSGEGWFYSRSRQKLWRKGESSGNTQQLVQARWDCDRDCVRFVVTQSGPTCHTGATTCFDDMLPESLGILDTTIGERAAEETPSGYTGKLLRDRDLNVAKLREEIEEVIEAETVDEVAWEAADVIYHLLVYARGLGVDLQRIESELRSRRR
ncbi:MAG: phosphoribosyl-AMP cyclohydrolase [Phycisphaerae bacterium]